jgi:hypothetical protein
MAMLRQRRANNYNSGMMLDLDAPIIPGKSAGGVTLGSFVDSLLTTVRPESTTKLPHHVRDNGTPE